MKHIIKRNNTYYANFTDKSGKRIRTSLGKELAQAEIKLRYLMMGVKDPSIENPDTGSGKVYSIAVSEWIAYKYKVKNAWQLKKGQWHGDAERQPQSVTRVLKRFRKHANIHFVANVSPAKTARFIDSQIAREITAETINKYIQFLKAFFKFCVDRDYIKDNPTSKLELQPETPKETFSFDYLEDKGEVKAIVANAGCYRDFIVFSLNTGVRPTDMWNLSQENIHMKDGHMFLSFIMKKTVRYTVEPIHIPLTPEARQIVEKAGHRLFPNANEELWRKALLANVRSHFEEEFAKKHIRLHALRHTFAMKCGAAGMPIKELQQLLGHSSVTQTEKYYRLLPDENMVKAISKIPSVLKQSE